MKPWYKSTTLWLNIAIAATVAILEGLQLGVPPQYAVFVTAALNFLNRFRTSAAIGSG